MQLHEGVTVHQSQSDDGVIEVVDSGDIRSLHFGTFPRQSCMSFQQPHALTLSYTQAMMAVLLFNRKPERILVIGLGGGSLVKYCLHHFDACQVDVIENRQDVANIAHDYFQVPRSEPRLTIHIGDGAIFVQEQFFKGELLYDMILVDAYDDVGMAESIGGQSFFDACAGLLTSVGVMAINLWGTNRPQFNQSMSRINQSFAGKSLTLPVEDKGNIICLATQQLITQATLKRLKSSVVQLEQQFKVDLPKSLYELTRRNRPILGKLFR